MNKTFLVDLAERTISTYLQALLGLLLADSTHLLSLGALKATAIASLPAALAVVKGALAGSIGTAGTASLLPAAGTASATPAPAASTTSAG